MIDIFRHDGEHYVRITPVQQLKNRIAELEKENLNLADRVEFFDSELSDCKTESFSYLELYKSEASKNFNLEKENTDLLESNADLAFQVDELESTVNMLNNTNEDLRAEIDEWRNQ